MAVGALVFVVPINGGLAVGGTVGSSTGGVVGEDVGESETLGGIVDSNVGNDVDGVVVSAFVGGNEPGFGVLLRDGMDV